MNVSSWPNSDLASRYIHMEYEFYGAPSLANFLVRPPENRDARVGYL